MKYNPLEDNFVRFEAVETPKVEIDLPLLSLDISKWASRTTENGTPVVKENIVRNPMTNNNPVGDFIPSSKLTSSDDNISFEELVERENLPVKITSSFRGKGDFRNGKTKSGKRSNHNRTDEQGNPMAYDIVPINGDFESLLNKMYSNPRVVSWLKNKGYGILEETTSDIMRRTGATGKHLHIGPDSLALQMTNKRLLKGLEGFKVPYSSFTEVEIPQVTIDLPLEDSIDISNWSTGVTDNGTPIVKDNLKDRMINNNPTEKILIIEPELDVPATTNSTLSNLIDEVSQEKGYEGLKNPDIKNLLMLQAKRESNYNSKARSKGSSASGYFQLIDDTRKRFTNLSRKEFLNDPKEQVRAAYKLLMSIHNSSNALKLLSRGYNMAQVTALGWWYPASMRMVLNGEKNFTKGGYSIQQALSDYA